MARWGEGKATVVFKEGFSVAEDPRFVDKCIRIANALDRRVNSISILFEALERFADLNEPRLKAQIAWRGEVFAEVSREPACYAPRDLGFSDHPPGRYGHSHMPMNEEEVSRESLIVLRDHAERIVSEHRTRVQRAEYLLEVLPPVTPKQPLCAEGAEYDG